MILKIYNFYIEVSCLSNKLKFNEDGKFKILVVADLHLHETCDDAEEDTLALLSCSIEKLKPDLTVLLGDNINGWENSSYQGVRNAIGKINKIFLDFKTPFALIFGNHDAESGVELKDQIELYKQSDYCHMNNGDCPIGFGNYNLPIWDSLNNNIVFNLWFIDSGDYIINSEGKKEYAYVSDEQISWYENKSNVIKEENHGFPVLSLLFQHMPVPEVYKLLKEVSALVPFSVKGHGVYAKNFYIISQPQFTSGELMEGPCPPNINNGQFDSWVKQGDIIGAVFGHDHINDFVGKVAGITLMQTKGAGFSSYGDGLNRGVRLITLDECDLSTFQTKTYYFRDIVGKSKSLSPTEALTRTEKIIIGLASSIGALATVITGSFLGIAIKKIKRKNKK